MAKQSPLQRTSGSLFDVAPKPGEGKGFNSTAPSAYDESDFASKHVTIWAPISAAFGVLSLSALVSLPFLFLSIFAVVAGLIAFYAIFKSGGEASGRGVASAGLILGLATLIGAPTHNYVYRKDFGRAAPRRRSSSESSSRRRRRELRTALAASTALAQVARARCFRL